MLFLYLVCVALSIRLQFGGKAMFGVPGCFSKCNMLQRWGNLQLYMTRREPQFHHEIKPIAVDFQMFHLQELLGVKSVHSEISCGTRDIPEQKKGTPSLLQPENMYITGLKRALILFSNCNIVARLLFLLLWNPFLVHCSNATKPALFFLWLDFGSPRVFFLIVLCRLRFEMVISQI